MAEHAFHAHSTDEIRGGGSDSHTHAVCVDEFRHPHAFLGTAHRRNESRILIVTALTAVTMAAEIACGQLFGSLALLADGWHMGTHMLALGIAALAYRFARRHQRDARFSFGTGKAGDLAAFASALILGLIALGIAYESLARFAVPVPIRFSEALLVATIGLLVNLGSAALLAGGHAHGDHAHPHHHADHNARAAFVHVAADAATSVLAILGLFCAWIYGWAWIDPLVGLIGAAIIAQWSVSLMRQAGAVLLDAVPDPMLQTEIRATLEQEGDRVADLHLWRLGPGSMAAIVSVVSDRPLSPADYKAKLSHIGHLDHVTVEVQPCTHAGPAKIAD